MGVKAKVKNSFIIYREQELNHKVAMLARDSEIEIILYDSSDNENPNHLFLIKSQTGSVGWVKESEIYENLEGLPLAD